MSNYRQDELTEHNTKPPYDPSWIDLFNNWVEYLPANTWIYYFSFGIVLIIVQLLFLWLDGGLSSMELLPIIIFNGLATPLLFWLVLILDNQAVDALHSMRSVLNLEEKEFENQSYELSNMPLLSPIIAGLILTIIVILTPLVAIEPVRYAALERLPVFTVVFHIIDKSSAFMLGVVLYHTIRQLRIVNSINSNLVQVSLFHLKPLQAFSRLTATTTLVLLVFFYLWMLINPELLNDPVLIGFTFVFTLLAVAIFVWPLWGVHKLLDMEKDRELHEIDLHFDAVFSKFNKYIQNGDYASVEGLNKIISSLEIQHNRINAIPTWPWKSETARLVLTAIALPLVLMIIQFFVLHALNQ